MAYNFIRSLTIWQSKTLVFQVILVGRIRAYAYNMTKTATLKFFLEEKMYWGRHLIKMLKAVDILARPGGAAMEELAEALDVDRRTAYRIRGTLEELNFPLYEDSSGHDGRKRYRFEESYLQKLPNLKVPALTLSLSEIIALYFSRGSNRVFRGTDIEKSIEAAFTKLDAFMPEGLAGKLEKVKSLFIPTSKFSKDYKGKEGIIESLTDAVFHQKTCLVEYHSFYDDKMKAFKIDPLKFFERDGGLYLFVQTSTFANIRVLAVERIHNLIVTDVDFDYPKEFDPDTRLKESFDIIYDESFQVRIRFSGAVKRYIEERKWAQEQTILEIGDGKIELNMKTSGWIDVKKWVLSFGDDAELIEPLGMREEISEQLQKSLTVYLSR